MGVAYSHGATAKIIHGGPALAPAAVQRMFPDAEWTTIVADHISDPECMADRFGENFKIQQKIFAATPTGRHMLIGGDHSVNFGHFAAIANQMQSDDICMVYIDAHLDIHTPATSQAEASGAPHGTNVRALLGDGDARWLSLTHNRPVLKPENLFYLGTRSYEKSEITFVRDSGIFTLSPDQLQTATQLADAVAWIRNRINGRRFIVSFDFDAIDPILFRDVLVPEPDGISVTAAEYLLREFHDAYSFEFVEYAPSGDPESAEIVKTLVGIAAY